MAAPQSTPLPPAPSRSEGEAVFVPKANAFLGALEPLRVDIQAQADFINDAASTVAASNNFAGRWSALTGAYSAGISVSHNGTYWGLLDDTANIALEEPGVSASWQVIFGTLAQGLGQSAEAAISQKAVTYQFASLSVEIQDAHRRAVEDATGGRNTVRFTNKGQPCYFYVLPKYNLEDLPGWDPADGTGVHPAFIQNGVGKGSILVGIYQAAEIAGEAVSQGFRTPKVSINYDNARNLCKASGAGFDMMSNWDWSAVAMWCMANGFQPRGNSDYGRSHANKWETGRLVDGTLDLGAPDSANKNTLTGSGPNTWRHDNSPFGIADLVGNVWEWNSGFKTVDGVAHIAPDNGVYTEAQYLNTGFSPPISNPWSNTSAAGAPSILKQALIIPSEMVKPAGYGSVVTTGERLPRRGGGRNNGSYVGLGALYLADERTNTSTGIGFRLTFRQ